MIKIEGLDINSEDLVMAQRCIEGNPVLMSVVYQMLDIVREFDPEEAETLEYGLRIAGCERSTIPIHSMGSKILSGKIGGLRRWLEAESAIKELME